MKHIQNLMIIMLLSSFMITCTPISEKKVLIYTRNGEGYVHDNIPASVEALSGICAELGISSFVTDDPDVFDENFEETYEAVIFSNTNNRIFDNDKQRKIFKKFIQNGGGYVGIHIACGSERDWPWYWAMVGGKFLRHPKYQTFDIRVIDDRHISTEFLPEIWKWEDECYYMNHLNPDIHVLLAADLRTVDDPDMEKFPGDIFGELFPLAWYHEYDGGRQFFTALGHDIRHYQDAQFLKHLKGGIIWALDIRR